MNVNRYITDGWIKKEKDNLVHGELIGRFFRDSYGDDNSERYYYKVKLFEECKAILDKDVILLLGGDVVNLDEIDALKDLKKYCDMEDIVCNVWILYGEKKKTISGNDYWPIVNGPRVQMVKAPPKVATNDIPF